MRCLLVDGSGVLSLAADGAACAVDGLVVLTQAEASAAFSSPFALSVEDAYQVGGAIMLVWAAAFGIRALVSAIRGSDHVAEAD